MAVAQYPRDAGERPVRAGGGGHVAGGDWWTGPAGWVVGVAPVSRAALPPSLPKLCICHPLSVRGCCLYVLHAPHLYLKNFYRGFSPPILCFSPKKRVFHINFGGFPLCLGPRFYLVRTFPEEDTHDRD